jgi:hypothetical protein
VTDFVDETPGRLDHIRVAEVIDGVLRDCGQVRFGVGRELRGALEEMRAGELRGGGVAVEPWFKVTVRYFGRHRSGALRDGVLVRPGVAVTPSVRPQHKPDGRPCRVL